MPQYLITIPLKMKTKCYLKSLNLYKIINIDQNDRTDIKPRVSFLLQQAF